MVYRDQGQVTVPKMEEDLYRTRILKKEPEYNDSYYTDFGQIPF